MKIINNVKDFIMENELKILVFKDRVNIVNYDRIGQFDSSKVVVHHMDGSITVKGTKLAISKLVNDEVLIIGKISTLELG